MLGDGEEGRQFTGCKHVLEKTKETSMQMNGHLRLPLGSPLVSTVELGPLAMLTLAWLDCHCQH